MEKYSFKGKRGIDDLKSLFAFRGNSQGDESVSNDIEAYKSSQGWLSFVFDCELTDEAIAQEIKTRREYNERYIQTLKNEGRFGEEYTINVSIAHNPIFDSPEVAELPIESCRMVFLDF